MNKIKAFHLMTFNNWRFLQLSLFLILLIFISPVITDSWLLKLFIYFVFLNSIFVTFSTAGNVEHHRKIVLIVWTLSAICSFISFYSDSETYSEIFELLQTFFNSILLLFLIYDILVYMFKREEVTLDIIFASLSTYLLIAFFFGLIYTFLYNIQPGSFRFSEGSMDGVSEKGSFFYFSIITISTLGYGDIVPASNVSRAIAVVEAVAGQFFVAVVVSLLVGKLVMSMGRNK